MAELLALAPDLLEKVDIARMNLLCAEGLRGSENLNVEQCLDQLDAWTQQGIAEKESREFTENGSEFY